MSKSSHESAVILLDGRFAQKVGRAMNGGEGGGDVDCAWKKLDHFEKEEAGGLGRSRRQRPATRANKGRKVLTEMLISVNSVLWRSRSIPYVSATPCTASAAEMDATIPGI